MATAFFVIFTIFTALLSFSSSSSSGNSLCFNSPNPSSCRRIVSDALTSTHLNTSQPRPDHLYIVQNIISRSLHQCEVIISATAHGGESPAVVDCMHLLELSRLRLHNSAAAVAAGDREDAVTWLGAVLTNHDTCILGLQDANPIKVPLELEARVKELKAMASAALAVFSSTIPAGEKDDSYISRPLSDLPSWVPVGDQTIMKESECSPGAHRHADAVVDITGRGRFRTVQAAVDAAPNNSDSRYVIHVRKGRYNENVLIRSFKKNIMIVGDGIYATIITGHRNVVDGGTTFNSGTMISEGDNFLLQDITIRNDAGAAKHQAVALRTSGDKTVINRCLIDAYQDTLYTHQHRQFVRDSTIVGTIDVIFGNAAVVLQSCKIVSKKPMRNQKNVITAQGRTDPNTNTGISIQYCLVIPSRYLAQVKRSIPSYLGRPWREYSRTVYMQSYIDSHIVPEGWLPWNGNFALDTLFYGEYANHGPGARTSGRVKWLGYRRMTSAREAMPFTVRNLIQGDQWLRSTCVPFRSGLY